MFRINSIVIHVSDTIHQAEPILDLLLFRQALIYCGPSIRQSFPESEAFQSHAFTVSSESQSVAICVLLILIWVLQANRPPRCSTLIPSSTTSLPCPAVHGITVGIYFDLCAIRPFTDVLYGGMWEAERHRERESKDEMNDAVKQFSLQWYLHNSKVRSFPPPSRSSWCPCYFWYSSAAMLPTRHRSSAADDHQANSRQ